MNNLRRATILLKSIGEPQASEILGLLSSDENMAIIQDMMNCPDEISDKDSKSVLNDFLKYSKTNTYSRKGV